MFSTCFIIFLPCLCIWYAQYMLGMLHSLVQGTAVCGPGLRPAQWETFKRCKSRSWFIMIHWDGSITAAVYSPSMSRFICCSLVLPGPGFGHLSNTSNSKHAAKLVGPRFSSNQPRDRTFLHLQLKFAVIFPASRNSNVQSPDVPREVCQIQMNSRSNMYRLEQILWKIGVEERVLSIVQHTSDRPDLVIYWGWPSS